MGKIEVFLAKLRKQKLFSSLVKTGRFSQIKICCKALAIQILKFDNPQLNVRYKKK